MNTLKNNWKYAVPSVMASLAIILASFAFNQSPDPPAVIQPDSIQTAKVVSNEYRIGSIETQLATVITNQALLADAINNIKIPTAPAAPVTQGELDKISTDLLVLSVRISNTELDDKDIHRQIGLVRVLVSEIFAKLEYHTDNRTIHQEVK